MKVETGFSSDTGKNFVLVLDNNYQPIKPVMAYLYYLENLERSPNTLKAYAANLKLYWEFLNDNQLDWKQIKVTDLADFINWLRSPEPKIISLHPEISIRSERTINQIINTVCNFDAFQARLNNTKGVNPYAFQQGGQRNYKPFLHGIAKSRQVKRSLLRLKEPKKFPGCLTESEVQMIVDGCNEIRDKFFVCLLYETGMRLGEALGLRHEDIQSEGENLIHVVFRDNNFNGARAKSRERSIHVQRELMQLYSEYLIEEYPVEKATDYVFVNCWGGEIGSPVTLNAAKRLFRRLEKKTGVRCHPHLLRHTHATELIKSGWDMAYVQKRLGHAQVQTTMNIYVHLEQGDMKKAFKQFIESKKQNGIITTNSRFTEDIWNLDDGRIIDFQAIEIAWLREAAKHFIKLSFATVSRSTVFHRIKTVEFFGNFIVEEYQYLRPDEISRDEIIEYLHYLVNCGFAPATRAQRLSLLKTFFELCITEEWVKIQPYLITPQDFPKRTKAIPKFIPEEVIDQIIKKQKKLPKHILPMLLILMECGMRVSELCNLKKDCLSYDGEGDLFLTRTQSKNKEDNIVPISQELEEVIRKHIEFINQTMGEEFVFLFPTISNNKGKNEFISPRGFRAYLAEFSKQAKLKTRDGQSYHLYPHAFRHTVATQMINRGVPIHFIQRFLGHNSPEITVRTYAYIHDQTLKKELEKFHETKIVNISGEKVKTNNTKEEKDLAFFKQNVLAQALPNGYCGRPAIRGECPHANACLTCGDFRTTNEFLGIHKAELANTQKTITKASENGWLRQLEMNNKIEKNLRKIISGLENS